MNQPRYAILLLVLAALVVYSNSFHGPFIFDDGHGITENPTIRQFSTALTPPSYSGMAGRPVANFTFALNYAIGEYDVRGYHVVNLAIHILVGLALFGVVRRTPGGEGLAFPAALLWVVHPLATEGVTYLSQRTEALMGLCLLLTLYCAIRRWHFAAVLCCGLGMGCKEVMYAAPLLVMLYDYVFGVDRPGQRGFYAGLMATWLMLPMLMAGVALGSKMGGGLEHLAPWTYAKTQATVLVHYLRLALVPYPLVVDYDDWPTAGNLLSVLPQGVLVVGLVAGSLWGAWRKRWWGFLGLWFFLILAPTSSFLPLGTEVAAERRMYLPLMAVVIPVVVALRRWPVALGVLTIGFGLLAFQRNAEYRTTESIWRSVVEHRPNNVRALINLATIVEPVEAIPLYEHALTVEPGNAEAHYNLAVVLVRQHRLNDAVPHFQRAADLSPDSPVAQYQLALALAHAGQLPAAEVAVRRALALEPASRKAQQLLHAIHDRRTHD